MGTFVMKELTRWLILQKLSMVDDWQGPVYTFCYQWRYFLYTPSAVSEDAFCIHLQLSVKMLSAYTFSYQWRYFLHAPSVVSEDASCIHLQLSVKILSAYTFSCQWRCFLHTPSAIGEDAFCIHLQLSVKVLSESCPYQNDSDFKQAVSEIFCKMSRKTLWCTFF